MEICELSRGLAGKAPAVPGQLAGNPRDGGGGGTAHSAAFAAGWTMPSSGMLVRALGCGACYPDDRINQILVLARATAFGESISLYRAGLKLALFLPLGVAMPLSLKERRQVSPM